MSEQALCCSCTDPLNKEVGAFYTQCNHSYHLRCFQKHYLDSHNKMRDCICVQCKRLLFIYNVTRPEYTDVFTIVPFTAKFTTK